MRRDGTGKGNPLQDYPRFSRRVQSESGAAEIFSTIARRRIYVYLPVLFLPLTAVSGEHREPSYLYKSLTDPHRLPYGKSVLLKLSAIHRRWRSRLAVFRTVRPLLVDATQAEQSTTVSTRTGVYTVAKGDWIVTGENGETYFVDNPFSTHSCTLGDRSMAAGDERRPPLRLLNSERRYAYAKSVARKSRIALSIPEILLWPETVFSANPGCCPGDSHQERRYQSTLGAAQKRAHRFLIAACRSTQNG